MNAHRVRHVALAPGDDVVLAPWTAEQVQALNAFQRSRVMLHPFTCGGDHCVGEERVLVATPGGWVCPSCTYRQDWAHAFMARWPQQAPGALVAGMLALDRDGRDCRN